MRKIILFLCLVLFSTQVVSAKEAIKAVHKTSGIYIFKIDTKKLGNKIKPLAVDELTTAKTVFDSGKYQFVLNGGYFDMKSGAEISYVVVDGKEIQNPFNNQNLINNLGRTNRLRQVLGRGEFRILENSIGQPKFEIASHFAPIKKGHELKHSLQAGPKIAPSMDLEGESFVQYDDKGRVTFDSITATKRRPRTILALKGHMLYAIVFTDSNKKTLNELEAYCKKKRFKQALALDGGGSTSAYFKNYEIYSEGSKENQGRRVKSFLVIEN